MTHPPLVCGLESFHAKLSKSCATPGFYQLIDFIDFSLELAMGIIVQLIAKNPWDALMLVIKFERGWLHFNDFFLTKKQRDFFFSSVFFFLFSGGNSLYFPKISITQHWKFRKKKKRKSPAPLNADHLKSWKKWMKLKLPFPQDTKDSQQFAHGLDVYSCEQF